MRTAVTASMQHLEVVATTCRIYATVAAGLMATGALVNTAEAASTRELQGFKGFSSFDKAPVATGDEGDEGNELSLIHISEPTRPY